MIEKTSSKSVLHISYLRWRSGRERRAYSSGRSSHAIDAKPSCSVHSEQAGETSGVPAREAEASNLNPQALSLNDTSPSFIHSPLKRRSQCSPVVSQRGVCEWQLLASPLPPVEALRTRANRRRGGSNNNLPHLPVRPFSHLSRSMDWTELMLLLWYVQLTSQAHND